VNWCRGLAATPQTADKAKQDQLFVRVNDLLPTLRTLIDEICSQRIYWNASRSWTPRLKPPPHLSQRVTRRRTSTQWHLLSERPSEHERVA
jgi:hypothetical protein